MATRITRSGGGRLPADDHGGTAARILDLSNSRKARRSLTNAEVIQRVAAFLRSGDKQDLPPALRDEAEGILAMTAGRLAAGDLPWPARAARPDPGPGASIGEQFRALAGDERADAPSGLFEADQ